MTLHPIRDHRERRIWRERVADIEAFTALGYNPAEVLALTIADAVKLAEPQKVEALR